MFKRTLTFFAVCLIIIASFGVRDSQAQGGDISIGYVDPQAVLSKMPEMQAVRQRLQNFMQRKQDELAKKQEDFNNQINTYQQKSAVISDDAKKKEEERLGKLNTELQQYRSQIQQEVQKKQQELVGPLLEQVSTAIDKVAADMELTYVLNTTTNSGDVIILYASDDAKAKYDITDKVMQQLGI